MPVFIAALLPPSVNFAEVVAIMDNYTKHSTISTKPEILLGHMHRWAQEVHLQPAQPHQAPRPAVPTPPARVQVKMERSAAAPSVQQPPPPRPAPPRSAPQIEVKMEANSARPVTTERSATNPTQQQSAPRAAPPRSIAPIEVKLEAPTSSSNSHVPSSQNTSSALRSTQQGQAQPVPSERASIPAKPKPAPRPIEIKVEVPTSSSNIQHAPSSQNTSSVPLQIHAQPASERLAANPAKPKPVPRPIEIKVEPESPVVMPPPRTISTGTSPQVMKTAAQAPTSSSNSHVPSSQNTSSAPQQILVQKVPSERLATNHAQPKPAPRPIEIKVEPESPIVMPPPQKIATETSRDVVKASAKAPTSSSNIQHAPSSQNTSSVPQQIRAQPVPSERLATNPAQPKPVPRPIEIKVEQESPVVMPPPQNISTGTSSHVMKTATQATSSSTGRPAPTSSKGNWTQLPVPPLAPLRQTEVATVQLKRNGCSQNSISRNLPVPIREIKKEIGEETAKDCHQAEVPEITNSAAFAPVRRNLQEEVNEFRKKKEEGKTMKSVNNDQSNSFRDGSDEDEVPELIAKSSSTNAIHRPRIVPFTKKDLLLRGPDNNIKKKMDGKTKKDTGNHQANVLRKNNKAPTAHRSTAKIPTRHHGEPPAKKSKQDGAAENLASLKRTGKKALGPYTCEMCQKQLSTIAYMERHKKRFHA